MLECPYWIFLFILTNKIMIKDIAFTIYPVTNIEKSRAFYEGLLGLVPNDEFPATEGTSWIEYNVGPCAFAIGYAPDQWKPSPDGASIAFEVTDFEAVTKKLKDAGCTFKIEPMEFPTCHMAVVHDPDGSCVAIHKKKHHTHSA
jgi:predicted enzyme related to lactoylglutathione lyase